MHKQLRKLIVFPPRRSRSRDAVLDGLNGHASSCSGNGGSGLSAHLLENRGLGQSESVNCVDRSVNSADQGRLAIGLHASPVNDEDKVVSEVDHRIPNLCGSS